MLVSIDDIQSATGIDVPEDEVGQVEFLIRSAVAAVEGYLGYVVSEPVPDAVMVVVTRMVGRALGQEESGAPTGMTGDMFVAGSFTRQRQFASGSNDGGVWLSAQDKTMLKPYKKRQAVRSVPYRGF